ncbi:MAG: hypothetical protein JWM76_2977 [Pseudonocardiales bacterium]|nr:hypothetical protein [Pseudonocardiales bacterium]
MTTTSHLTSHGPAHNSCRPTCLGVATSAQRGAIDPGPRQDTDLMSVLTVLPDLTGSTAPTVVFASLAGLCVPVFADSCHVAIVSEPPAAEPTDNPWTWAEARSASSRDESSAAAIVVTVGELDGEDGRGYKATVTFSWDTADASHSARKVIAHLLVDRAVHLIRCNRLAARAAALASKAENL